MITVHLSSYQNERRIVADQISPLLVQDQWKSCTKTTLNIHDDTCRRAGMQTDDKSRVKSRLKALWTCKGCDPIKTRARFYDHVLLKKMKIRLPILAGNVALLLGYVWKCRQRACMNTVDSCTTPSGWSDTSRKSGGDVGATAVLASTTSPAWLGPRT